jgi:beta-lactamase regulating signal transducer with metallopeptidase domain
MGDLLRLVLVANFAATLGVLLVMLLRLPLRRWLGARAAYLLWWLAPCVVIATLIPARTVTLLSTQAGKPALANLESRSGSVLAALPTPTSHWGLAIVIAWIAGAIVCASYFLGQQLRFAAATRVGRGGPAVVGVVHPRIVTPCDFTERYSELEQIVVLAHEQAHIRRQDSRINALVAAARCCLWFNPLIHLLAHYLRIDQELAADASVVAEHPTARRSYAEALFKTQLVSHPLPLGCYWPAQAIHPLARRIDLLSQTQPDFGRAGASGVMLLVTSCALALWLARPPQLALAPPSSFENVTAATAAWPLHNSRPQRRGTRLLPPGFFGPPSGAHGSTGWSSVEPGSVVEVTASTTDPEGSPLTTQLRALGRESWYWLTFSRRHASRFKLFVSAVQTDSKLRVTAGLNQSYQPFASTSIDLESGETGSLRLPTGQVVTVKAVVRPQSPQEAAEARRTFGGHLFVNVERLEDL